MRLSLIVVAVLTLAGCAESSSQSVMAPSPSATFVWVMAVDASGVCMPGATVQVLAGPRLNEVVEQKTPCDAWAYSGGVIFDQVAPGAEMTLRASAPGYVAREMTITATSGGQQAHLFTLPAIK
jgi:hypothetical protein